jgi:hypothetical protein
MRFSCCGGGLAKEAFKASAWERQARSTGANPSSPTVLDILAHFRRPSNSVTFLPPHTASSRAIRSGRRVAKACVTPPARRGRALPKYCARWDGQGSLGQPVGVGPVASRPWSGRAECEPRTVEGSPVLSVSWTPERPARSPDAHDRSGVLGDPVGPRALRRGILPRCSGLWAVHVETPWPKPAPRVGVDVGTFEGLLAWVVLDARQPVHRLPRPAILEELDSNRAGW